MPGSGGDSRTSRSLPGTTDEIKFEEENPENIKRYPTGSRVQFRRGLTEYVASNIYQHSGIILQEEDHQEEYQVQL